MTIEIFSIGNELLAGNVMNTNVSYISKELAEIGFLVSRHTTLPDVIEEITKEFERALSRVDILISTGGLGPTLDDVTFLAASKVKGLTKTVIPNAVGSAPGYLFHLKKKQIFLLPGVPIEMKEMLSSFVLPKILSLFPKREMERKKLYFFLLSEGEVNPYLEKLQSRYPEVIMGIYPTYGMLEVVLTMAGKKAGSTLSLVQKKLEKQFPDFVFTTPDGTLAGALHEKLIQKGKTLSLAESCSGGGFAYELTRYSGSSQYLLGSIVAYSNAMKKSLLRVSSKTLKEKGAVSSETVFEMASGALDLSKSDYVVAISGVAGPTGGSKDKPVGTVCIAIGEKEQDIETYHFLFPGNREMITLFSIHTAMALLWKKIR